MDRSKKRRGVIVLKPPPEDWPEPDAPEGAKPPPSEFGATLPPMGTFIDTRLGRKGKGYAASFANPPYLGHRKIDFVPQFDKATANDGEASPTVIPSMKWRIRGRRDRKGATGLRQKGGGYLNEMGQEPGFRKDLTMKPPISRYYIAENTTFLVPTVRNTRPYQRSYFNFRMRYPMNVGRAFGPPEPPPYGQPPPPPHYAPNNPYGQPPYPQFPQSPYPPFPPPPMPPPYGPPPPYGQRPPPPPAFIQGIPHPYRRGPPPPPPPYIQPPPPPYDPHSPPPPEGFEPPLDPIPESAPPPSPYPTGPDLPPVHPFLDGIPTISPIDKGPAPWPRRQVPPEFRPPQPRIPEFLRQEPRNFSGYKGPRRGRAYEQYGKADLRPRHTKFFDEFAVRGTPRFPIRKGSGFGVEFQTDITGPPEVLGDYFAKRTWPTRSNKYGYEPYRRSDDRKRPYGFGRYAVQRPPILGDFGDYRPYKRVDDAAAFASFNFSRPTRSYTFPPRLRLAIKNASYYRRAFRRTGFQPFNLPTLPSIGLAAYLSQNHDYYGNPVTLKGRITNLEDLKAMFTWAPTEEAVEVTTVVEKEKKAVKPRLTAKPKGMTAREAMRAAAREAIKEAEMENWEARDRGGRRRGWRRVGGSGGGRGNFIRRGGARGSGMSPRNFRRAKRSLEEEVEWLKRFRLLQQKLETGGNYMTGPGAPWAGSQERHHSSAPLLRMHRWRSKGRPLRQG